MKALTLFLCLFASTCYAQSNLDEKPVLPIDTATNLITYKSIGNVPKVKANELYTIAREWFANNFKSANNVLQMDDRIAGKLIAKGGFSFVEKIVTDKTAVDLDINIGFTLSVTVKDFKYRIVLSDFTLKSGVSSSSIPLEKTYNNLLKANNETMQAFSYKALKNTINETDIRSKSIIRSLNNAMSNTSKDDF